jgi:gliding motility-associated lipoprotein GldD
MKVLVSMLVVLLFIASCGDELLIPKPPTYLRSELPPHTYAHYSSGCGYHFDISKEYEVRDVAAPAGQTNFTCHKDIDLGVLNGTIHFSYINMQEPLSKYVNFANDKVEEHKLKATAINDSNIIRTDARVYGTIFELQGDVASPFQFYLTDSNKTFVSGVVYFNSRPNYDSLRPSLNYLKTDLLRMINTFEWK